MYMGNAEEQSNRCTESVRCTIHNPHRQTLLYLHVLHVVQLVRRVCGLVKRFVCNTTKHTTSMTYGYNNCRIQIVVVNKDEMCRSNLFCLS